MLDKQETLNRFGYDSDSLSEGSGKKVVVVCDYCPIITEKRYLKYNLARKVIKKDCCDNPSCMKQKREESMLLVHGVKTAGNLPQSKPNRTKEQQKEIDQKRLITIREKYGVDNVFQLSETKEKSKQTSLVNYGVEHPQQSLEIQKKQRESMLRNHGVESPLQSEEIKERMIQTTVDKYGVDSFAKTQQFRDLCKIRRKTFNGKSYHDIAEETNKSYSTVVEQVVKYGYEHAVSINKKISGIELKFEDWLKKNGLDYKSQVTIDNYRPDFVINNELIVELNGNYWHSDKIQPDNNYHKNKRIKYLSKGYKPLFFLEDEVNSKFDIIESIVNNKLKRCDKVYARNCNKIKVDKIEAKQFFRDNHLMGNGSGDSYGLEYNGNIIVVIQVILKNDELHISRFATKKNYSVIGGFTKLLKMATLDKNPKSVINFVDLRYGTGKHLENYGFELQTKYLSFSWTDFKNRYHRMKFPGNSGYDEGLHKIWDCGQAKYVKVL